MHDLDYSDVKDETLWRSIVSDSDNPNDDSVDTTFFDLPDDDQMIFDSKKSSIGSDNVFFETGLLDAMQSLQIESAKKLKHQQESIIFSGNEVLVNLENVLAIQDEVTHIENSQDNFEKEHINSNTKEILEETKNNPITEVVQLKAEINSKIEEKVTVEAEKIIKVEEIIQVGSEENSKVQKIDLVEEEKNDQDIIQEIGEITEANDEKTHENIQENQVEENSKADRVNSAEETKKFLENTGSPGSILKVCDNNEITQSKEIEDECQKVSFVISSGMAKAMKPLLKQPTRKSTIPVTPKLMSSLKNRAAVKNVGGSLLTKSQITNNKFQPLIRKSMATTTTTITNSVLKRQSSNVSNTSEKSSASIKKNPIKPINTVSTITSTKDGMKLKEEKINNFSIPVTVNRKKRTQFVPFSFSSREKNCQQKLTQDKEKKSENTKPSLIVTKKISNSASLLNTKINKENKCNNVNSSKLPGAKTISVPSKFGAEKRVQERREFDAKVKQVGGIQAKLDVKKDGLEKIEDIGLRKKIITKPTVLPSVTGLRSKKILTVPQSPAWAIKNKRL